MRDKVSDFSIIICIHFLAKNKTLTKRCFLFSKIERRGNNWTKGFPIYIEKKRKRILFVFVRKLWKYMPDIRRLHIRSSVKHLKRFVVRFQSRNDCSAMWELEKKLPIKICLFIIFSWDGKVTQNQHFHQRILLMLILQLKTLKILRFFSSCVIYCCKTKHIFNIWSVSCFLLAFLIGNQLSCMSRRYTITWQKCSVPRDLQLFFC
jgi:hypothetical protein